MSFIYDPVKARKLSEGRGIDLLMDPGPIDVFENPARKGQKVFVVNYKGYICAVPYIVDSTGNYILKTVYPIRKLNKLYGGKDET